MRIVPAFGQGRFGSIRPIREKRESSMAENGTVAYVATLPMCDICARNGDDAVPAQFNGVTRFGPWAKMCSTHFRLYGRGLGVGVGQQLKVEEPGQKVELTGEDQPVMVKLTTPPCMLCGETSVVSLTRQEFAMLAHPSRPAIQDCLPTRDAAFRELVKTGTHDACWNLMMPKDERQAVEK
jgi:hypothetical protein